MPRGDLRHANRLALGIGCALLVSRPGLSGEAEFIQEAQQAQTLEDGGEKLRRTLDNWARLLARETRRLEEADVRERAVELWRRGPQPQSLGAAAAMLDLATLRLRIGPVDEAEALAREALALRERLSEPGAPELATILRTLDRALEQVRPADAEREAILLRAIEAGGIGDDYFRLSRHYQERKELARAVEVLEQGLAAEEHRSAEHGMMGVLLLELARLREGTGAKEDAEAAYRRAIDVKQRALGARHPQLVEPLGQLGEYYVEAERFAEAAPLLERALALDQAAWGDAAGCGCSCGAGLREMLEQTYLALGRQDDLDRLRTSPSVLPLSSEDPDAFAIRELRLHGKPAEALEQAERGAARARETFGPDSKELAEKLRTVGWELLVQGRDAEALERAREVVRILERSDAGPQRLAAGYFLAAQAAGGVDPIGAETAAFLRKELVLRQNLGERRRAATILQRLGTLRPPAYRDAEAVRAIEQALELWRVMADETGPEAAALRRELGVTRTVRPTP